MASATQDITVDALRIEQIGENEGKSMAAELQWLWLDGGVVINSEVFYRYFLQNFYKI